MPAGEVKVRKFQEESEMQEERVQKVITATFFLVLSWRNFFLVKK